MTLSEKIEAINEYFDHSASFTYHGRWEFHPYHTSKIETHASDKAEEGESFEDFINRIYANVLEGGKIITINNKKYKLIEE